MKRRPPVPSKPRRLEGKTCVAVLDHFVLRKDAPRIEITFECGLPAVVLARGWKCKEHAPKPAGKGKP